MDMPLQKSRIKKSILLIQKSIVHPPFRHKTLHSTRPRSAMSTIQSNAINDPKYSSLSQFLKVIVYPKSEYCKLVEQPVIQKGSFILYRPTKILNDIESLFGRKSHSIIDLNTVIKSSAVGYRPYIFDKKWCPNYQSKRPVTSHLHCRSQLQRPYTSQRHKLII